jgi:hypothetical protein
MYDTNISNLYFFILISNTNTAICGSTERCIFKIQVTFIEGQNRNVSDARVYVQEHPQYGTNPPDGGGMDLNDAFYNDAPYTGIWRDEIVILQV